MEPTKLDNASQIISVVDVGLIGENSCISTHFNPIKPTNRWIIKTQHVNERKKNVVAFLGLQKFLTPYLYMTTTLQYHESTNLLI